MANIWDEIELKVRARYPYLALVTHEEERVLANLKRIGERLDLPVVSWSAYAGFSPKAVGDFNDPLDSIAGREKAGLFMLRDFHLNIQDPRHIRQVKDFRDRLIADRKTVIITTPNAEFPQELDKQIPCIDVPLPDAHELQAIFDGMCRNHKLDLPARMVELFARSATGLTAEEAILIFSRMLLEPERVKAGDSSPVIEEKRRLIESEGVLQFYERDFSLDDVGGLHALKGWLKERETAFDQRAREFGLPEPKGLLLLGVQGCGKSLTAKAIASHWRLPLVHMDLGAAFSLSESPEERMRRVMKLLEALAPVVVWIDEIEKGFAGTRQGGDATTQRVFGQFITWLQEKRKPVFVVATANNVADLPPELLRKGRFDELFFVDLPDANERREVLQVHVGRRGLDPASLDLDGLVETTRNYTGAELEQVVVDGLYRAFARGEKAKSSDFLAAAEQAVPIYNTYEEDIKQLRDWAQNRTRQASNDTTLSDYFQKEETP